MDAAGAVTEASTQPQLTFPSVSYNISLNFTSIFSFLPSRLLANSGLLAHFRKRWEHAVDLAGTGAGQLAEETGWGIPDTLLDSTSQRNPITMGVNTATLQVPPPLLQPAPWAFFTSGYMLGLFIMAVLLHRIQNIIIPSRIPPRRRSRSGVTTGVRRVHFMNRFSIWPFPLDLSKTSIRLAIHLPSLYFLSKMLLCWFVLVLQTSDLYPVHSGVAWVNSFGAWVREKEMSEICWQTFCAVCVAFSVDGFVKALDGIEAGFPIGSNMNPNTSPFNIVGYAFLLHVYSSPFGQIKNLDGLPTRPDKHAIITVAIPLLQLTIFHALSVSKRLSSHRLLPTVLSSVLSLLHFHGALASHFYRSDRLADQPQSRILTTYPLVNYLPNIFETVLLLTIFLTVALNVLVQLVVRGRVDRVFSGLGIGTSSNDDGQQANHGAGIRAFFQNLPYDEDFGVLLLRIGTASLEATGLRGWSNEVAPVPAPVRRRVGRRFVSEYRHPIPTRPEYGSVRMGRIAAGGVQSGHKASSSGMSANPNSYTSSMVRRTKGKPDAMHGLRNEVRQIDLGVDSASGHGGRENRNGWWRWVKEVVRYAGAMWAAFKGLMVLIYTQLLDMARGRGKVVVRRTRPQRIERVSGGRIEGEVNGDDEEEEEGQESAEERDAEVYARFLRGENISDDEDGDDTINENWDEDDNEENEEEEDAEGSDDTNGEDEAIGLFTDILRNRGGDNGSHVRGDVVLAHLVDESTMTRSRWMSLSTGGFGSRRGQEGSEDDWAEDMFEEEFDEHKRDHEINARNVCVICTVEGRDIICWPCRCLAMCDGCREALASRSAPAKHRCPCCRQIIEGYSRIYIP